MKTLLVLRFWFLPLAAHFDYFKKLSEILAEAATAIKTALGPLLPDFNAWLEKEDAVMRWVRKSILTEKIAAADDRLDRVLVGINATVQAYLHAPSESFVAAATRLHAMIKNYGDIIHESYDKEAGEVRALIEQFSTPPYSSDVSTLQMGNWMTELSAAFTGFENLLSQRESEQGQKPPYIAKTVRKGIENVYQQMVRIIDAHSVVETDNVFGVLIDRLNPKIAYLNTEFAHARKDLGAGGHTVIEPVGVQPYTERPVTPVPEVHFLEDGKPTVRLWLGADFEVTYKNNIKIGQAELTIHGKGHYKGQKSATFHIAK